MIEATTIIDIVRHGQVATAGLFSAPTHEPLGTIGWQQLKQTIEHGEWDIVLTSPSRRCRDFARHLAQRHECDFQVLNGMDELDFGDWIGLSSEEICRLDPELMQYLWKQPMRFIAPHGESMGNFIRRVRDTWAELLEAHAGKRVLLLTHATNIRVILVDVLQIPYLKTARFRVDYATLTRVQVHSDGEVQLQAHGVPQWFPAPK